MFINCIWYGIVCEDTNNNFNVKPSRCKWMLLMNGFKKVRPNSHTSQGRVRYSTATVINQAQGKAFFAIEEDVLKFTFSKHIARLSLPARSKFFRSSSMSPLSESSCSRKSTILRYLLAASSNLFWRKNSVPLSLKILACSTFKTNDASLMAQERFYLQILPKSSPQKLFLKWVKPSPTSLNLFSFISTTILQKNGRLLMAGFEHGLSG